MKKALIINASPRASGSTAKALAMIEERLTSRYWIENLTVSALTARPCAGCGSCRPDGTCVLPRDGGHDFGEKISDADLVVIGTPCYWGNLPGPLKILLDRNVVTFERFVEGKPEPQPRMKGKKAIVVVTAGSGAFKSLLPSEIPGTIRALKKIFSSGGIRIAHVCRIPRSWDWDRIRTSVERKIARIRID